MAAIRAKEVAPDLDVTVVDKGDIRRSGTIAMGMDAMNVVVIPGVATEDDYLEAIRRMTEGVYDPEPHRVIARRSLGLVKKLESWGVEFAHQPDGAYVVNQIHPNARFTVPMHAPDLKLKLAERLAGAGVRVVNRVMVIQLLADEGGLAGAIGLDLRTGDLLVCAAKAVILTAGGAARFGLPNSGYLFGTLDFPGNAGDGYALAYRAGAQLTGMECTTNASIVKDLGVPLLAPALPLGAYIVDSRGKPVQGERGAGIQQNVHLLPKVWNANHANGPLFLRLKHLPEERVRQIEGILFSTERPAQKRFFAQRGIDFRQADVELGPTEHKLCGGHGMAGIAINERAEASVPGLYAAGDAAGVAFQYLTGAFVLGEVAAEQACGYVRGRSVAAVDERRAEPVARALAAIVGRGSSPELPIHEFEYKVRRIINDYVVPPKNEWKLRNAVNWTRRFREELGSLVRVRDAHELSRLCEIGFIIDCAELSATASLARRESRWLPRHYRTDYPEADDANWLRHVLLRRGADGSPVVSTRAAGPAAEAKA